MSRPDFTPDFIILCIKYWAVMQQETVKWKYQSGKNNGKVFYSKFQFQLAILQLSDSVIPHWLSHN